MRDDGGVGVKLIAFVRRKPGLSRAEFSDYWEHHHAPLFLGCSGIAPLLRKYVQNHVLSETVGPMSVFDGVVEIGFASIADAQQAMGSQENLVEVAPDHANFLDDDRQMVILATDERLLYEDALGREDVLSLR